MHVSFTNLTKIQLGGHRFFYISSTGWWSCYLDDLNLEFMSPQALLQSEKERADNSEKKYTEAQESSEERHKKLEETEKKVQQLQESLSR